MTHGSGLRSKLVMLLMLVIPCAAPVRAEQLAFMNAFDQWQVDPEADAVSVVLSPDGKHVYVARDGSYYISRFDRDAVSGDLTFAGDVASSFAQYPICDVVNGVVSCQTTIWTQEALAMSPDGRHLYVCLANRIVTYARDAIDGSLVEGENIPAPGGTCSLTVSRDGSEVYATSSGDVDIMARDPLSGSLTEVQRIGSIPGIESITGFAASGDGLNLYVGNGGGTIEVLRRDGGAFVVEEVIDDGVAIPEALGSHPTGLVVSADGKQVYAGVGIAYDDVPVGGGGGALVAYNRAPDTGRLTVLAIYQSSAAIGHALWAPNGVFSNADGSRILVGEQWALSLFARDADTGLLTFLGREDPYCVRVGAFHGVALSSDGVDVYADTIGGTILPHYRMPPGRVAHYRVQGLSCPATPVEGGESATASAITIKNDADDSRDQLKWDWTGIDATGSGGFGQSAEGFAVCVYTDSGSGPELAYESFAPAGNCWVSVADGEDFAPASSDTTAERLNARVSRAKLQSKRTPAGIRQKIRVLSKKLDAMAPQLPLPSNGPTRVQLLRSDGRAWEASYGAGDVSRNDATKFKAKR